MVCFGGSIEEAEHDLCYSKRTEEAHSTAMWSHPNSSKPVMKGPNNGIKMGFKKKKKTNSQILRFTNETLLTGHKHWLGYINYNNNDNIIINIKNDNKIHKICISQNKTIFR
jgi:hypothetical protein